VDDIIWCAAPPAAVLSLDLDGLTALYHRPSGQTHIFAEPVPQILAALADGPLTAAALLARLDVDHAVEGDLAGLDARLTELADAGLVSHL
jgi:PqqD family protein of HPr-rel-A system